ncbi:MAG: ATP-dependent nuclease [Longicatena caecimuris]|uniref:ATP-dependent nuclease n=1 Tax=Longicatena caecimuris TaxID=1796635 RepID=UPI00399B91D6
MITEKTGGYISRLEFNTGESLDVKKNDIVVFVGPNNAGKSQSLKDIYTLSSRKLSTIVVSDIEITKSEESLLPLLQSISSGNDQGSYTNYSVLGHGINYWKESSDSSFLKDSYYGEFRDLFVANLDTAARLKICTPPNSINRNASKQHPIHYAAFDRKYRKWLSDNFKKAFGIEVTPNTQYGATIPLCIGEPVKLNQQYDDEQQRLEAYAAILDTYKQVQNQGDGIKSFTGILLYLMLDYYRTYLIDEPESFLHPPQARIMGQIIGQTLTNDQQAFISTHSEEIIKGLLEACPQRIKIVRITRKEDTNAFSILSNEKFDEVWNDPLLKYSNIMSSLFHKVVVLCESDSDCKMYSIVENFIKRTEGKYSEVLFIHCGGKHRMAKISTSMRALNIDIRLIPDIDILNDETIFKNIVEAYGIDWTSLQSDYNIIVSNLHSPKEKINRNDAKTTINRILDASENRELSNREIKEIRSVISTISKWDALKSSGISAIPAGDATVSFRKLEQILRANGIYIVPVGELEGFVKEVGGHGPDWVNKVLEKYPDLNAEVYAQVRQFISAMNL